MVSYLEAQVFRVQFFMRHYHSPSMKPTMVVTNNPAFGALDMGPVPSGLKRRSIRTTRRYQDGNGKARYVGTKSLKKSQKLGF